jgi:hypothetical protein
MNVVMGKKIITLYPLQNPPKAFEKGAKAPG